MDPETQLKLDNVFFKEDNRNVSHAAPYLELTQTFLLTLKNFGVFNNQIKSQRYCVLLKKTNTYFPENILL